VTKKLFIQENKGEITMRGSGLGPRIFLIIVSAFFVYGSTWANDIEIDLGGPQTSISKSSTVTAGSTVSNPSPSQENVDMGGGAKDNGSNEENSSARTIEKSISEIDQVTLASEGNGKKISFEGQNLNKPTLQKLSSKKILLKFKKTTLKFPSKINENDEVVKDIRSSMHSKTAWIVLDVNKINKLNLEKMDSGYALLLNETESPSENSEGNIAVQPAQNSNEKGFYTRLIDVSVKPTESNIKLVLTSDSPSKYIVRKLSQPEKIIVHFFNTKLDISEKLKNFKNDDVALKKGGLLSWEFRQIGPSFSPISEAILTVLPGTVQQIDRDLNQVVITLTAPPLVEKPVEKRGNLNQLVSLDLEDADLNAVIKMLAGEGGFDLDLVSGPVTGIVNQRYKDVPLKTALANLLAPGLYSFEVQGNTLRVGTLQSLAVSKLIVPRVTELIAPSGGMTPQQFDTLVRPLLALSNAAHSEFDTVRNMIVLTGTPSDVEDYKRAIRDLKLDESTESNRITRVVKLNYADPTALSTILAAYLTPVGKIQVSGYKLVIWETASNMGTLLELINELDRKPPQVLIESNIVEVDNEADLNLGVQWTFNKTTGDPTVSGNLNFPPSSNVQAVNGPGIITFGTVKAGVDINATLEALESHKKGKIISRPRIATTNGVAGEINEVENVVITTETTTLVPSAGVSITTTFTELPLPIDLKVTPRITDEGTITNDIAVSITSQTGPAQGPGAPPPTSVQTATTRINIKNGETIVIGGLVRENVQEITNGIPILSSLPIIGSLFEEKDRENRKEELVIFITPTLLED
jgi:type II secretory pathway component GspD/PulD (secretin)